MKLKIEYLKKKLETIVENFDIVNYINRINIRNDH